MSYSAGSQQLVIVDPHGAMTKHAATQETLDKYGVAMKISEFTSGSMTCQYQVLINAWHPIQPVSERLRTAW